MNKTLFKNFNDFYIELLNIKSVNMLSPKTTKEESINFCSDILSILQRGEKIYFDKKHYKILNDILEIKGCLRLNNAPDNILYDKDFSDPLMIFSMLMDSKNEELFNKNFKTATNGGFKNSFIADWLNRVQNKENLSVL